MVRYQIGVIEGQWKNFVPPIQGGIFRRLEAGCGEEDESSGSESTAICEDKETCIRRRSKSPTPNLLIPEEISLLSTQTEKELAFDIAKYPSLDAETQSQIIESYRALHARVHDSNLYACPYTAYIYEALRILLLLSTSLILLHTQYYIPSALTLGLFWTQLVFLAHDAGHLAITHNYHIDTVIGMSIASIAGGLSLGWWKKSHNVHHVVTNSVEHDPDNQHLPILAVSTGFLGDVFSSYHNRLLKFDRIAKMLVPWQRWSYYPVLALGRLNLYVQSYTFLLQGQGPRKGVAWWHRYFEILGVGIFWYWYGHLILFKSIPSLTPRIAFLLTSHLTSLPLHIMFTLSHFSMSTSDLGPKESFPQKMLRTTMDVSCRREWDWVYGGLQFQVAHHLFPRVPRHNLRKVQGMVEEWAGDVGVRYERRGWVEGNWRVLGSLGEVGRLAGMLGEVVDGSEEKGRY